jgi:hypothetical protein
MKTPFVSRRARRQLARVTNRQFVPQPNPSRRVFMDMNGDSHVVHAGRDFDGVPQQRAQAMRSYRGDYAKHVTDDVHYDDPSDLDIDPLAYTAPSTGQKG